VVYVLKAWQNLSFFETFMNMLDYNNLVGINNIYESVFGKN